MPHKYVHVDGVATFLHHRGPTTLPERPPDTSRGEVVLCLHGRGGNGHVFAALLDALAERHSPLAFDQPAHGRSAGLDGLGAVDALADFTAALAAKLGLRPFVALGHDLVAAVALELALRQPALVRGLVLCSAAPRFDVAAAAERLGRVVEGKARREFDVKEYSASASREVLGRAFAEWMKTDPRATLADLRALDDWSGGASGRLGGVAVPTLVVDGEDAPAAGRAAADALAAALPRARRAGIAGAGGHAPLEQPAALAREVERFLAAPDGPDGRPS
jgi:3-oxoadipate enol-lactonase